MYEQASERWSPVQSVEKVILSVISMLAGMFTLVSALLLRYPDPSKGFETFHSWTTGNILGCWPLFGTYCAANLIAYGATVCRTQEDPIRS
jgi:hypothetical protein